MPPRVTVGIPVYNGEHYLADALDSILPQTAGDFELIISDNASTDSSAEIAERYAAADQRVRYVRNESNIGGPANFNKLLEMARGEYFKWAAHDDLIAPAYLRCCIEVLDQHPDVVLVSSRVGVVDEDGRRIKQVPEAFEQLDAPHPARRIRDLLLTRHGAFHLWGIMRTDLLRRAGGHGPYPGADRVTLVAMALRGRLHLIPNELFMTRDHRQRSVRQLPSIYRRAMWHDPRHRGRPLPHWKLASGYLGAIRAAPISQRERIVCLAVFLRWLTWNWTWARLANDLLVRVHPVFIAVYERLAREAADKRRASARGVPRPEDSDPLAR
jgi:glycosyltransferase involved in cell wall biosynthesis